MAPLINKGEDKPASHNTSAGGHIIKKKPLLSFQLLFSTAKPKTRQTQNKAKHAKTLTRTHTLTPTL